MTEFTEQAQTKNSERGNAWNVYISPRLVALRSHFADAAWKEALYPYMKLIYDQQVDGLIHARGGKPGDDDYLRGRISMLSELMALPEAVEKMLAAKDAAKKKEVSRGQAGY